MLLLNQMRARHSLGYLSSTTSKRPFLRVDLVEIYLEATNHAPSRDPPFERYFISIPATTFKREPTTVYQDGAGRFIAVYAELPKTC